MKTILLHGLGQTSSSWKNTINTMGKSADILCPNLFDWFEDKEVCYQVLYLAFSEYCKQFSEPVNICGLSLGGILALQYGIENPDKINSLALVATQYTMPKKLLQFQNMLFRFMPKRTFESMGLGKTDFINLSKSMINLDFQKELKCINYYDGKEITIPLDPDLNAMENAKKYFDRYGKLKRTYEALSVLTKETYAELSHLESVSNALEIARDENDLAMIKEELIECGYMKRHGRNQKKRQGKSKPLHYISSDGFHMYVGKNNFQNDELSFKFANGKDMWFHAKKMAGSHVIVKLGTANELPDSTYEEAARLAAHYSKGKNAPKVEVDYTERRNLKKPPQAKPGYVIYHTNYSMLIAPDISGIEEVGDK